MLSSSRKEVLSLTVAHQNIAFKAQGSDGFSTEIEGFLFDANGDTLTGFPLGA